MIKRLLFTSPIDRRQPEAWPDFAAAVQGDLASSCGRDVTVEIGDRPVFSAAADTEETLLALEEQTLPPRSLRIDFWSDFVHYSGVSVLIGAGVRRKEKRELMRRLSKGSLRGQTLLREHEGAWDEDAGQVFGYRLQGGDAGDRATFEHLLFAFDQPLYLAEKWLLMDQSEQIDSSSFEAVKEVGLDLALFLTTGGEADERLWQTAEQSDGIVAMFPDDEAEDAMIRHFRDFRDLPIFVAEEPSAGMRVTLGRSHGEESLVVVYGPPHEPEVTSPILFMY